MFSHPKNQQKLSSQRKQKRKTNIWTINSATILISIKSQFNSLTMTISEMLFTIIFSIVNSLSANCWFFGILLYISITSVTSWVNNNLKDYTGAFKWNQNQSTSLNISVTSKKRQDTRLQNSDSTNILGIPVLHVYFLSWQVWTKLKSVNAENAIL